MTVTAAGVIFAVMELEESKKATKAKITLDYELARVDLAEEVTSKDFVGKFIRSGGDLYSLDSNEQEKIRAYIISSLFLYQVGYIQWKEGYIDDSHWKLVKYDVCALARTKFLQQIFSNEHAHKILAMAVVDEFIEVMKKCPADPLGIGVLGS